MDILMSLYKQWADMILSGEKPIEFRTRLPKDFSVGDKIYIYETGKRGGRKKVVGHATVKGIISVLNEKGKWPMLGAYPFIDFYFEHIKNDKEKAEHYRKIKKEAEQFTNYRYGFILNYAFSEHELQSLRETGSLIDTWSIHDTKLVREIIDANTQSSKYIEECDEWLTKIGFYNDFLESYYKFGIVLDNIVKYDVPLELNEMMDKSGNAITKAPQSWMYVSGNTKGD